MNFGDWEIGRAFDVRTGESKNITNYNIVMPAQIRPTGETDESKFATVQAFGEYIANNSPVWVKAKRDKKGGIKWGSSGNCRSHMMRDERNGWRYFDVASFGHLSLEDVNARIDGPPRIGNGDKQPA